MFHQNNSPAHTSVVAMAAVHDCGFELIDYPPYSPDLAPSDYILFPNMKQNLAEKQYRTDDKVISAAEDFFKDQEESVYTTEMQVLQHGWKKCVDLRGGLSLKINHIWSNLTIAS